MKSMKFIFLSLIAIALLTFSCKSDDDNGTEDQGNFLTVNGETYVLANGFIQEYGELSDGVYDWDVFLFSEGLTEVNGELEGSGEGVYFDLRTENVNGLSEGTYVFDADNGDAQAFTYVVAEASLDLNSNDDASSFISAISGTIVVEGTGSNQVITFNLNGAADVSISGRFEGSLQMF